MREVSDLLSLIWINKEFPAFCKTSDILVCFEVRLRGKRAECVQSNTCHWKGSMSDIQVYRSIYFLLDICISSPVQRFWPSAEKWLSVTVLVAKFVHLENKVLRVYTVYTHNSCHNHFRSVLLECNVIVCLTPTSCFFLVFLFLFFFNFSTVQSKISRS